MFKKGDMVKENGTGIKRTVLATDKEVFYDMSYNRFLNKNYTKIGEVFMFKEKMKVVHKVSGQITRISLIGATSFQDSDERLRDCKDYILYKKGWEHGKTIINM